MRHFLDIGGNLADKLRRLLRGGEVAMKILCVLYDDPIGGMPSSYPRDGLPKVDCYPGGTTLSTPQAIDFTPGELLG